MNNPKVTLILDSTQITDFLTCPSLWAFGHRERLEPVGSEAKEAMTIGTYGHKLLELWYKGKAGGKGPIEAIGVALAYDFDKETCRCQHSKENHAQGYGIDLEAHKHCTHIGCQCQSFEPSTFPLDLPVRELVRQRFREYTYTYSYKDIEPHSPDTVEVGFSYPLHEDNSRCYVLEGRIDLLGKLDSQSIWLDHKFQMRQHTIYNKSIQFRNYAMVCNLSVGIINYVRMTKGVTKDTFSRQVVSFSPDEHRRWKTELIGIYDAVAGALAARDFNDVSLKNRASCPGRFGYSCQFTPLCEEANAELIEIKKKNMYQVKPVWSPW